MKHDDLLTIRQMRDAAVQIRLLISDRSRASLAADDIRLLAVLHLVQTIGEAARRTSAVFREAHPDIPWAEMVGMRNRIVHGYDDIDDDLVWAAATAGVEQLLAVLVRIADG